MDRPSNGQKCSTGSTRATAGRSARGPIGGVVCMPVGPGRRPATIVIPVWNQWELTKACLDSLRPTLGVRDEVVIVDNGSEDGTPSGLAQYPWARVITNE